MSEMEFRDWPPAIMNLNLILPWSIVRPAIFRFMEKKYVDEFFADGSLRLSSFAQFSQHPDEPRRDEAEGTAISTLSDGNRTAFYSSRFGVSSYVLCGSISSAPEVTKAFGPSAIVIHDTVPFAAAVARALPGYRQGLEGFCEYQDGRLIYQKLPHGALEALHEKHKLPDGKMNMDFIHELANHSAIQQMLLKDSKYSYQLEYRLIWECTQIENYIDIKIPEALQFCKRIDR